nr:MAG TPA: tail tape measure protein [Caudoviricetes sp.]
MALEIFRLVGSIFVDSDAADKSIQKTDEKAQGFGKTLLKGIGTAGKWAAGIVTGAAAATAAVAGISSKAVSSYADYEQLVGGVETLFGESADTVIGYADKAYKTAGLTANQYMDTVTSFSASLLQGLNGDTAKAAEVANMAITDMSDNANKMGTDMSSIRNAYQGFAKQNYTMLDNLKLGYGGTKQEMERLLADAEKLSGQKYDISSLNDVYQAIHVVQTEMGITGTTAKEAESTISGGIAMIKSKLENFKTSLGSAIAPTVQQFLALAIDNLPTLESMIAQLAPVITGIFQQLGPPLLELASSLLPMLISLFNAILPIASQLITAIVPVIIQLLETLLPPIIQIVETLLPPLLALLQPILDLLGPLIELLQPILDLVVAILDPIAELITGLITPLITIITELIQKAMEPLRERFEIISQIISGTFSAAVALVMSRVEAIKGVFSGVIQFVKGVFTGDWKSAWQGVQKIFSSIWDGIKAAFKIPINWIINGLNVFIRGINKIRIPSWVPVVGGRGFSISEIPQLAKGGVLEKGQTGFLEGNGAEAVVPLHENKRWISAVAEDMDRAVDGQQSAVHTVLLDILALLERLTGMKIVLDTGALVGGLADPMDRRLGQIKAQKARA